MEQVSYEEFSKIGIYSGTIIKIEPFLRVTKPAYKIWADFGEHGILQTSSQVTYHYTPKLLLNKKILGCINIGIKNIAGFKSEFLLLGCYDKDNKIILPEFLLSIQNGSQLL